MALESNNSEAFLGYDAADDDFAALDSMAFTGNQSQFGMNTVAMTSSGSFGGSNSDHSGGRGVGVGDGRDNGFSGVSGSLFDRIRARTAEQQKQSLPSQSAQGVSQPTQEAAQSSQQSAFMSQQPSSQPNMEIERINTNTFDAAVNGASTGSPANQNANLNNNETTYSFSATAGEDFSQAAVAPNVPVYGASRDDPYYAASNNQQQQLPTTIQDKATMALAQTGETVKSLWDAGVSGAQTIGTMAQEKMGGGGDSGGGGQRSYNNNFLLREDSLEHGNMMGTATMSQPPPPAAAPPGSDPAGGASDQAYSMLHYGKTFFQDISGFVMQLPPWGKGVVAVVSLWVIYVVFGFLNEEL